MTTVHDAYPGTSSPNDSEPSAEAVRALHVQNLELWHAGMNGEPFGDYHVRAGEDNGSPAIELRAGPQTHRFLFRIIYNEGKGTVGLSSEETCARSSGWDYDKTIHEIRTAADGSYVQGAWVIKNVSRVVKSEPGSTWGPGWDEVVHEERAVPIQPAPFSKWQHTVNELEQERGKVPTAAPTPWARLGGMLKKLNFLRRLQQA